MSYDSVLQEIGEFGPFQKRAMALMILVAAPVSMQILSSVFLLAVPDYRCAVPGLDNDSYVIQSPADLEAVKAWLPVDAETGAWSTCDVIVRPENDLSLDYVNNSTHHISNTTREECSRWVYSTQVYTSTLGAELNLVCGRKMLTAYSNMASMVGLMVGSLVGGVLADRYGRLRVLMVFLAFHALGGFLQLSISTFPVMVILRFLEYTAGVAIAVISFTWTMEIVGPSMRPLAGMIMMFGWVLGMLVLGLAAYLCRDWRTLQLVISSPTVMLLAVYWILPESPRWLYSCGQTEKAAAVMEGMAEVNNVKLKDQKVLTLLTEGEGDEQREKDGQEDGEGLMDICRSPTMVLRLFILSVNWCVCSMVYYGLSLNVGAIIEGDLYLNFFIMGGLELLTYLLCWRVMNHVGRKAIYCACIFTAAFCCLATMVPILLETDQKWINTVLSNLGKMGVTGSFAMVYIYTAELLPTSVRNTGVGLCSMMGRIGSILSPYIGSLHMVIGGPLGSALPLVVFGSVALLAGVLATHLPETRGHKLPDTVGEARDMGSNKTDKTKDDDNRVPLN